MGTDDAQDRGKTQATPQEFGGKEWIEYMSQRLGSHATSVVADFEADIPALAQIGAQDRVSLEFSICPEQRCGDANHTFAPAEGFRGIDRQIQQDLPYLGGVTRDSRQSRRE